MSNCPECGLPMNACNALASYRLAVEAFRLNRIDDAEGHADSAKDFHDEFMKEHRESRKEKQGNDK